MPPEGDSAGLSSSTGGLSNLPWSQVPSFKPGETDLTEWSRKVEFLASLWPPEQLHLLAPRVALQCEGSAFQRVARLDPKKLRVGSLEGVKAIVEALGGIWGKSRLEDKFERFERAIYSTVQRANETHSEDKKRLIVESQGSLEYREVVSNLKLLGSRFFHEVHSSGKKNNPMTETYEANAFIAQKAEGHDQAPAESTYNFDDWTEEEWIESLANDGDEDAALIMDLPELTEETLNATQEKSKQVLCGCESRDTGVLRVLWETNEGEIIVLAHKGEMVTECENCDVRTN